MNEPTADAVDTEFAEMLAAEDAPSFHTVLEVWREVLKPAAEEATRRVTPNWAARITAQFPQLQVQDMNMYRDVYYGYIDELVQILHNEIAGDPECLTYTKPEDDASGNGGHYKDLLGDWQLRILSWELNWDCLHPLAHIEIAAISEVHKLFFGPTGITAYLDNIGFEYTEADQAALHARLEAAKDSER